MHPTSGAVTMMPEPIMTLEGPVHEESTSISYFPDGKRMISAASNKAVRQWDLQTGEEIENARNIHEHEVRIVVVSRDGRWAITVTATRVFNFDGDLKACEVETGIVKTIAGHSAGITCVDISMDSSLLASGSEDSTARLWSLETGKLVAGPFKTAGRVGAIRFSQDSKKFVVESWSTQCLEVWDIETQKLDARIGKESMIGYSPFPPMFWTNKGTILAAFDFTTSTPNAKMIYEFDPSKLDTVGIPFEGHTKYINCLALSFDGALLASTSCDNTIKLWAVESHQLLSSFDVLNPYNIILSPVSHQLAYTSHADYKIYICNIPPNILASIGPAIEGHKTGATLGDLLESDATRRPASVRHTRVISPVRPFLHPPSRPLSSREPQQPVIARHLRNFLRFKNTILPVQNVQPRDPLDFPATTSLPPNCSSPAQATAQGRLQMDSCESSRRLQAPPTTLSLTSAPTALNKTRLVSWRPIRAAPPIVDVPLAQGLLRNAQAGAPKQDEDLVRDEYFDYPPSPNNVSQQPSVATPTNTGEHSSGRFCSCF